MSEGRNLIEPSSWPRRYTLEDEGDFHSPKLANDDEESETEFIKYGKVDRSMQTVKSRRFCGNLSFSELQLIILLFLAIIIIVLLAVVVLILRTTSLYYCTSTNCVKQAGVVVAAMNLSADPCNDFYNYACGKWDRVYTPKPGVGKYSGFFRAAERIRKEVFFELTKGSATIDGKKSSSVEKAVTFYKSCMDTIQREKQGIRPFLNLINETGGCTLIPQAPMQSKWSLTDYMTKTISLDVSTIFGIETIINPHETSKHIIELTSGYGFFSKSESLSTNPKYKKAVITFGQEIVKVLGGTVSSATIQNIEKVWDFQLDLEKHKMSVIDSRNPSKVYNTYTVEYVYENILNKSLDVYKILNSLYKRKFEGSEKVIVKDINYWRYLGSIIPSLDKKILANLNLLKLARHFANSLTDSLKEVSLTFKKVIVGTAVMESNWEMCVELSTKYFPLQVTALYIQKYFNVSSKMEVRRMIKRLTKSLLKAIINAKWMDKPTKSVALAKVKYMQESVAFPHSLFNITHLDNELLHSMFDNVSFFSNYITIRKLRKSIKNEELGKPVDRKRFSMAPLKANAYFSPTTVTVKILAGILQPPFYANYYLDVSNFGALGSVIGHEMNHAFDSRGRKYGAHGNLQNWWTNETYRRYQKKAQCFINQYSKYEFHGLKNRGAITVAENMADNGGIEVSLSAYKDFYKATHPFIQYLPGLQLRTYQLFFLAFAQMYCGYYTDAYAKHSVMTDVHSPYSHRVLGTLSNQKDFAKAFKCPAKSKYNPSHRCVLW